MIPKLRVVSLVSLLLLAGACASIQTHVSPVADVANAGAQIEASAHVIFDAARTANVTISPITAQPVLARAGLDRVALAVNKIGHLGLDLDTGLAAYNAAKAAGTDLTATRATVQTVLTALSGALNDIGTAIPPGVVATIDHAVATIVSLLTQVKGTVGL